MRYGTRVRITNYGSSKVSELNGIKGTVVVPENTDSPYVSVRTDEELEGYVQPILCMPYEVVEVTDADAVTEKALPMPKYRDLL